MLGFFESKKFIGVDIGTASIRAVELSKKGRSVILNNYGEAPAYFGSEQDYSQETNGNSYQSGTDISQAISLIYKESKIKTKSAVFSIPDFYTFITNVKIPFMDRKDIDEAIKYEVRPYIPLPVSELSLDWAVISGEPGKTKMEIVVAAIPNDIINHYQKVAKASGLKLKFLEPEAFALARIVYWSRYGGVVGLIDMGARSTTCNILEQGILKMSYNFNLSGNELTERLARSFDIDYNKAEGIKKKHGLGLDSVPELNGYSGSVKKTISLSVDMMIDEIKKVFRNFYKENGKEVDQILITGGVSLMPGIMDYFKSQLNKEVLILNPFINISHPAILKDNLEAISPFYAVSAGLALKGLE